MKYISRSTLPLLVLTLLYCSKTWTASPEIATAKTPKPLVYGKQEMVVTNNPWASRAASQLLREGGSAVDAAIGAAFVLGLTEPQSSGPGGGGYALVFDQRHHKLTAYNGRETAPKSAFPSIYLNAKNAPIPLKQAILSPQSIGVPGEIAMFLSMHQHAGQLPWARLLRPAIRLASQGFPMSPRLFALLQSDQALLIQNKKVKAIYFTSTNQVKPIGSPIINLDYAKTLTRLAKHPSDFYQGSLAHELIKNINHIAGYELFEPSDFMRYTPSLGEGLCSEYLTYEICSTPFESGGVTVLELIKIFAYASKIQTLPWYYLFLEASKLAFADRNQYIADPHFNPQPLNTLIAPHYIEQRGKLIGPRALHTPLSAGVPKGMSKRWPPDTSRKPPGTTSLAIVDKHGNGVSMTLSIEHQFGSHIFLNGFFLNNELTDFSFLPGTANCVEPFKRPRSAIAPVMVFNKKRALVGLSGSPGGSYIICYMAKTLIQVLGFHQSIQASIASGNLCAPNSTAVIENNSDLVKYIPTLAKLGEHIEFKEMVSGLVYVQRSQTGGWYGAADPRREGKAIGR